MLMTYFLVFTFIFILATICFIKLAYFSIQPGQWFDHLFHWQKLLDRLYSSRHSFERGLYKMLGGCVICFSHTLAFISFWVYYFFAIHITGAWITDMVVIEHNWKGQVAFWGLNVIWYVIYMSITTTFAAMFTSKE